MLLSLSFLSHWFFFCCFLSALFKISQGSSHNLYLYPVCRRRLTSALHVCGTSPEKNNKNLKKGRLGGFKLNCSLKELKQEVKCVSDCLSVDLTGQGTGDGTGDGSRSSGPVQWKY